MNSRIYIPDLTRSLLYRCLKRNGISRLGNIEEKKTVKKKFKKYSIGFFHIDITEVRTDKGKLHLFVSIKRTSKFVVAKIFDRVTTEDTKFFFEHLISIVSYCIHTVITDNGI